VLFEMLPSHGFGSLTALLCVDALAQRLMSGSA
jgi:hypothetical protein